MEFNPFATRELSFRGSLKWNIIILSLHSGLMYTCLKPSRPIIWSARLINMSECKIVDNFLYTIIEEAKFFFIP